jgi:hypothetical protein
MTWQDVTPPLAFTVYWLRCSVLSVCLSYVPTVTAIVASKSCINTKQSYICIGYVKFYIGQAQELRIKNRRGKILNAELSAIINIVVMS